MNMQYGICVSVGLEVIAKDNFFQKLIKFEGQRNEVTNCGAMWKVLSQAISICNMLRKLLQILKFFFTIKQNFKVKVKITIT